MAELVPLLTTALVPSLATPFVFYGHSMGARLAFEVTRELRRRGAPMPQELLVSGRRAPHCPESELMHALGDPQLVARLRRLGGLNWRGAPSGSAL